MQIHVMYHYIRRGAKYPSRVKFHLHPVEPVSLKQVSELREAMVKIVESLPHAAFKCDYCTDEPCFRHRTFEQGTGIIVSNHPTVFKYNSVDGVEMEYGMRRWKLVLDDREAIITRPNGVSFTAKRNSKNGKSSSYSKCVSFVISHLVQLENALTGKLEVGEVVIGPPEPEHMTEPEPF